MNLFQTLEDRCNVDEIENNGPFKCSNNQAWLGAGYYYWDTFIENAQWWGRTIYQENNYVIAKSFINFKENELYDLDNAEVLKAFTEYSSLLKESYPQKKLSPATVIKHMIDHTNFEYKAIRARGTSLSYSKENHINNRLAFTNSVFLDMNPKIQICIRDKNVIGLDNFKVIYPDTYRDDFMI